MPLSDDQFDTIIQNVIAGEPVRRRPYPVLRFAIGVGLFTIDAGLVSFFLGVSRAIWHW